MKLPIIYNPQTDNASGKYDHETRIIDGNSQCGYAMAAHVSQPLFPDMAQDVNILAYLTSLESDKPGTLGARIRPAMSWFKGNRLGAAIDAHSRALAIKLEGAGRTDIEVVQCGPAVSTEEMIRALDGGSPIGCMAVFQLSNGTMVYHFETIIGYDQALDGLIWYVHDSYGNFYPAWDQASYGKGASVSYPDRWFRQKTSGFGYCYYWKKK